MSNHIKVNYAGMVAASQDIKKTAQAIDSQLDDLRKLLAPLAATWTGEAAELYQQRQRAWDAAQRDQQAVLGYMATLPLQASDRYAAVDRGVGKSFL